jgi:hypothetical protein
VRRDLIEAETQEIESSTEMNQGYFTRQPRGDERLDCARRCPLRRRKHVDQKAVADEVYQSHNSKSAFPIPALVEHFYW